jgi:hypothetical protein|tara:strand:+ start:12216 stop:12434 length:219 start_codon:yes stop_codon:yes gene_type:complete
MSRSFIEDLTYADHMRLREVVKRVFLEKTAAKHKGVKGKILSDIEADRWIESMGPRTMEKRIKIAVDSGMVK